MRVRVCGVCTCVRVMRSPVCAGVGERRRVLGWSSATDCRHSWKSRDLLLERETTTLSLGALWHAPPTMHQSASPFHNLPSASPRSAYTFLQAVAPSLSLYKAEFLPSSGNSGVVKPSRRRVPVGTHIMSSPSFGTCPLPFLLCTLHTHARTPPPSVIGGNCSDVHFALVFHWWSAY